MKLYKWFILIAGLLFAFSRGIKEGMVMVLRTDSLWIGPREYLKGHAWFDWYHAISLAPFFLIILLTWLIIKYKPGVLYIFGLLLLVWQFTEMGESFARNMKLITPYENINFADVLSYQVKGFAVYMIHSARVLFGITFIHVGR